MKRLKDKLIELTLEYANIENACNIENADLLHKIHVIKESLEVLGEEGEDGISIPDWCRKYGPSIRLWNALVGNAEKLESISLITKRKLIRIRGVGQKSWLEFEQLRGY